MFRSLRCNTMYSTTALYASSSSNFIDLEMAYLHLQQQLFDINPSKQYTDLVINFFITTNKKKSKVELLISEQYQLTYLKEIRKVIHKFNQNYDAIKENPKIVDYKYYSDESDDIYNRTVSRVESCILEIPVDSQESAKLSLKSLEDLYQFKHIRIQIKIVEKALSLLKKLETALSPEIPSYKKVGSIEAEGIKLLLSFNQKTKELTNDINKEEALLESYKKESEA